MFDSLILSSDTQDKKQSLFQELFGNYQMIQQGTNDPGATVVIGTVPSIVAAAIISGLNKFQVP